MKVLHFFFFQKNEDPHSFLLNVSFLFNRVWAALPGETTIVQKNPRHKNRFNTTCKKRVAEWCRDCICAPFYVCRKKDWRSSRWIVEPASQRRYSKRGNFRPFTFNRKIWANSYNQRCFQNIISSSFCKIFNIVRLWNTSQSVSICFTLGKIIHSGWFLWSYYHNIKAN